jgi:hypothetical protein
MSLSHFLEHIDKSILAVRNCKVLAFSVIVSVYLWVVFILKVKRAYKSTLVSRLSFNRLKDWNSCQFTPTVVWEYLLSASEAKMFHKSVRA